MTNFVNHKNNLFSDDKLGLKDVDVNKGVIYNGDVTYIRKKKIEEVCDPNQSLAAAVIGVNNTAAPLPTKPKFLNAWTDIDAQEVLLGSKPTCYLLLSKPGAGVYGLGEALSKKLKCIHLCPHNMITDEIEQKSSTGKCIEFNMRHNKVVTFDTLLKMLKSKLDSPAIQHRGYIISGFPLVTSSKSLKYLMKTLHGEDVINTIDDLLFDTIANLKKKKKHRKLYPTTESSNTSATGDIRELVEDEGEFEEEQAEEQLPEEEQEAEIKVELPKFLLNTCSNIIQPSKAYYNTKKMVLLQQVNDLFSLKLKPDVIIYISCPDKDLVTKKTQKFINYKNNHHITTPFTAKSSIEIRWPIKYVTSDYISPFDNFTINTKYCCKQPINFKHNSLDQMCNYKHDILPFLEKKLKEFDPKYVLKLDARLTVHEMMHNLSETLLTMPIMPVMIPEPLFIEEPSDDIEEFWTAIQNFNVIRSDVVTFNRSASLWYDRCPVELKRRRSVRGNPKLAVAFSKCVYLTATLDNMICFCRNPRPYLKMKYLEPTCRVIVIGTKSSGKTMISECLSWLFDTSIIHFNTCVLNAKQNKYDTYAKTILSEIIATIEDARFAKWQNENSEKISNLETWCKTTITKLRSYILLYKQYLEMTVKSGMIEGVEEQKINIVSSTELMKKYNNMRDQLSFLPFLEDIDACSDAISVQNISQYAPTYLTTQTEKPILPVLGDEDVTEAIDAYIAANDLKKEIEPSKEEIMNKLQSIITSIDAKCQKETNLDQMYGKYIIDGFPSDPEYWNILTESKLLPDYTIALIENKEMEPELIEKYKTIDDSVKKHYERYILAKDPLLETKLRSKSLPEDNALDIKMIIHDLVRNCLSEYGTENAEDNRETDPWASFAENVDKFKEEWDNVKIQLEEYNKCFISVELENKSDIEIVEEVLLRLRKSYFMPCCISDDDNLEEDGESETPKDIMTHNANYNFGETNIYCPISYYQNGVLWEGKPEFTIRYDNKLYRLCKEEFLDTLLKDVTKYQSYNKPFKALPPLRICIIGCIGSGKTTISKLLAKELGLMHIDFSEVINDYLIPKHFQKVGRRYENSFTDAPMDDEAVVELQMGEDDENMISNMMYNETELRKMVYNYYERGAPVHPQIMQKMIKAIWFQDPFLNTGFVLDGYPRLPSDVEDMITCFCIPDLIIEIEGSSEHALKRLSPKMFNIWKMQLSEAKEKVRQKIDDQRKEWMDFVTKNIVVKLICNDILEKVCFSNETIKVLSNESVIIDANPSGSGVDVRLFNAYYEIIQEYPEPIDQSEWEKADEARERIDTRIEGVYETDDENIQALKDVLMDQRIKTVTADGKKSLIKVTRLALSKLTNIRNRNESFFETTIIINTDIAELLLLEGLCYLSKFYRMCPVYIYENPNAIQNIYYVNKRMQNVFPILHRSYVYFICGEKSVKNFRLNPLKYVSCNNILNYYAYPLRIGVIGGPKSGKSTLAANLAKRYGLICLSRGIAVRYILENKHWTELATKMRTAATAGECISWEHVMKAVQALALDHRTYTNGYVLDGFPDTASEAIDLAKNGIYPNFVFDISANIETVKERSQKEIYYDILKRNPPYSRSFIESRYKIYQEQSYKVRNWIESDYQNLYVLDGNKSRWQCLQDAVDIINDAVPKVHYYLTNVQTKIVPAGVMCISNETFQDRMSNLKNLCPMCFQKNILRHNAYPVDKKGIVQYRNKFYWVCSEHMTSVLNHPYCFLNLQKVEIPELPAVVNTVNMNLVYENGVCIVTYAENLPAQKIIVGTNKYAAGFQGNTYMFCSNKCLQKFLAKPHMYYDITVFRQTKIFPPLSLQSLPNIGYLEQVIANIITEACCSVNVLRPKYPGLTFQVSGLLHIGLHLKTHNPRTNEIALRLYLKASKTFDARCKLLAQVALFLRSMDNPFAKYPACCTGRHSGTHIKPSDSPKYSSKLGSTSGSSY